MGSVDVQDKIKELQERLTEEQDETAQMIFDGLNSTDKILNLVREGIASLTEVCYRQDGLGLGLEDVHEALKKLAPKGGESREMGECLLQVEDKMKRLTQVFSTEDEAVLAAAAVLQSLLAEAENANRILHTLEEQMAAQLEQSCAIYIEIEESLTT